MPRVTFSNELNDFVKGFTAGSAIYDAADERNIKRDLAKGQKAYYEARAAYYGNNGGDSGATAAGDAAAANPPWRQPSAVPTQGNGPVGTFGAAVNRTFGFEGGKGTDSNGAAVNMGINAAANPDVDVNHLSRPQAQDIYKTRYWDAIDGDKLGQINPKLAHVAFDTAVNSGPDKAKELIAQSGGDPLKLLDLREQFLHRLAASRPEEFGPNIQKAWAERIARLRRDVLGGGAVPAQAGARGGMIRKFEFGGMNGDDYDVDPDYDADDTPSYNHNYPNAAQPRQSAPAPTPSGNFLDVLPDAVKAGLTGLQDMFGLRASAAPAADHQTVAGATAMLSGDGAPPPEQVAQLDQKVDPEGKLDTGMRSIARISAIYQYYVDKGDMKKAQLAAAQLLQANFLQTQKLGAIATAAIHAGDMGPATKAVLAAYNMIPNGKQASVQGDNVVVTDQKSNRPVEQFKLTPQVLLQAASGLADGSAYHNQLMAVASGKPTAAEEQPDPAFEKYVAGDPPAAPNQAAPAQGAPAQAAPAQAVPADEESVDEAFKPTTPRPELPPQPSAPDVKHMTSKEHQIAAGRDYTTQMRDWDAKRRDALNQYNQNVALEKKDWSDKTATARQHRHEEAGKIDEAFDSILQERTERNPQATPLPTQQQNDIREAARGFVRTQDMSREQGIRVAMQVYDPKEQVELKDLKGGGKITFADGGSYKLDAETYKRVKKAREGFKKLAEEKDREANKPGAWETIKSAVSF